MRSKRRYWILLGYLAIMFIMSAGVTLSKYTTSSYGSDSASVASMGKVRITEDDHTFEGNVPLQLVPGVGLYKNIGVSYDPGEVSCYVFFTIDNLNLYNEKTYYYGDSYDSAWFTFDINGVWNSFNRGDKTVWYVLAEPGEMLHCDVIRDNLIAVSDDITRSELQNASNLGIRISASAVQYNGEDSPEVAYDRINSTGGH